MLLLELSVVALETRHNPKISASTRLATCWPTESIAPEKLGPSTTSFLLASFASQRPGNLRSSTLAALGVTDLFSDAAGAFGQVSASSFDGAGAVESCSRILRVAQPSGRADTPQVAVSVMTYMARTRVVSLDRATLPGEKVEGS